MSWMSRLRAGVGLGALALVLALPGTALAHERREVGNHDLVVGWMAEPAFVGEKNGIDLRVTHRETEEPVEGLEATLTAEILFGGQRREVELRPVFGQPGRYTADLVPTREGDYRFRFFGSIADMQVDETFDSADGGFNDVTSIQEIQFPEAVPSTGETAVIATAADQNAAAAQQAAGTNQTLGIAALAIASLGVVLGGLALSRSRRQTRAATPAADDSR